MWGDLEDRPPPVVELYPWLGAVVALKNEAAACDASAYEVLDQWGVYGYRRQRLIQQLIAMEGGMSAFQRDQRNKARAKKQQPGTTPRRT